MLFDVEKVIRVLGYIVYTILWLPVIVLALVVLPLVVFASGIRYGMSVPMIWKWYKNELRVSFAHDMEFIKTGKWL